MALPSAGGAAGGAVVDSAALDAFAEKVTGSNGVLAATARFVLNELGVAAPAPEESEDENAAVVAAVEAELGSDWPKQVAPRFDANKAILFDDRWASAREDLARAYYDNDPAALNGSFIGLGKTIAAEASGSPTSRTTMSSRTPSRRPLLKPSNPLLPTKTPPATRTTSPLSPV